MGQEKENTSKKISMNNPNILNSANTQKQGGNQHMHSPSAVLKTLVNFNCKNGMEGKGQHHKNLRYIERGHTSTNN